MLVARDMMHSLIARRSTEAKPLRAHTRRLSHFISARTSSAHRRRVMSRAVFTLRDSTTRVAFTASWCRCAACRLATAFRSLPVGPSGRSCIAPIDRGTRRTPGPVPGPQLVVAEPSVTPGRTKRSNRSACGWAPISDRVAGTVLHPTSPHDGEIPCPQLNLKRHV